MADPLSMTITVLTLLQVSLSTVKTFCQLIESWRRAPVELLQLSTEIRDLNDVLPSIERTCRDAESNIVRGCGTLNPEISHSLRVIIMEARHQIDELDNLLRTLTAGSSDNGADLKRLRWLLSTSKVKRTTSKIKSLKMNMLIMMTSLATSGVIRIEIALETLQAIHLQSQAENMNRFHLISSQLVSVLQNQGNILPELTPIVSRSEYSRPIGGSHLNHIRKEYEHDFNRAKTPSLESSSAFLERPTSSGTKSHSSHCNYTEREEPVYPVLERIRMVKSLGETKSTNNLTTSIIRVTTRGTNWYNPASNCDCDCHILTKFHSPKLLQSFFGLLLVAYSGIPIINSNCNRSICQRQCFRSVTVTYHFPAWFLARIFQLMLTPNSFGDPFFTLAVRRRLIDTEIYTTICQVFRRGDIDAAKSLLDMRAIVPNDQDRGGRTPLLIACSNGQVDTCELLLNAGADPSIEADNGCTALTRAAEHILLEPNSTQSLRLKALFFGADFDCLDLPRLHQIVLGIIPGNLDAELSRMNSATELDEHDLMGKTALHWAAARQNIDAIHSLLRAGADINCWDREQRKTPLFEAACVRSAKSIEALLIGGADRKMKSPIGPQGTVLTFGLLDVNDKSEFGENPRDNITWLKSLIQNRRQLSELAVLSPGYLNLCAVHNLLQHWKYFVGLGADINELDCDGDSPLFETIFADSTEFFEFLLEEGARYDQVNTAGHTVLHVLAIYGGLKTIKVFARAAEPRGLNPKIKDRNGLTARDHLSKRATTPPGFVEMFDMILERIPLANSSEGDASKPTQESVVGCWL